MRTNPLGLRLGYNKSWQSKYMLMSWESSYMDQLCLKFNEFIIYFFSLNRIRRLGLIYSHFTVFIINKNIVFDLFFHNGPFEESFWFWWQTKKRKKYKHILKKKKKKVNRNMFKRIRKMKKNYSFFSWKYVFKKYKQYVLKHMYFRFFSRLIYKILFIKIKRPKLIRLKYKMNIIKNIIIFFLSHNAFLVKLFKLKTYKRYKKFLILGLFLRRFFFVCTHRIFFSFIKKMKLVAFSFFKLNSKIRINFLSYGLLTALIFIRFIIKRLGMKYNISELVFPILEIIKKYKILRGIRIICAGRFTRKQRTFLLKYKSKINSICSFETRIDYSFTNLSLKYGACCIRILLLKNN